MNPLNAIYRHRFALKCGNLQRTTSFTACAIEWFSMMYVRPWINDRICWYSMKSKMLLISSLEWQFPKIAYTKSSFALTKVNICIIIELNANKNVDILKGISTSSTQVNANKTTSTQSKSSMHIRNGNVNWHDSMTTKIQNICIFFAYPFANGPWQQYPFDEFRLQNGRQYLTE